MSKKHYVTISRQSASKMLSDSFSLCLVFAYRNVKPNDVVIYMVINDFDNEVIGVYKRIVKNVLGVSTMPNGKSFSHVKYQTLIDDSCRVLFSGLSY